MNALEISQWDSLKPWLPQDPKALITEDFLKSLGFGHDGDGNLTKETAQFVDACVSDLVEVSARRTRVYGIKAHLSPRKYPDVEKACAGRYKEAFWDLLNDARERITEDLGESDILDNYDKRFDRFSRHWSSKRGGSKGDHWELNWESASQDDSMLWLLSDWSAGFWETSVLTDSASANSVFGELGQREHDYATPWAAFVGEYLELLGIAMWTWWVPHCANPDSVLETWRYNLGQHLGGEAIDNIYYDLGLYFLWERLEILQEPDQPRSWTPEQHAAHLAKGGWFTKTSRRWVEAAEFAGESNENTELIPPLVEALKVLRADTVERIADALRREKDVVVVTTSGDPVVFRDNGRSQEPIRLRDYMAARIQTHAAQAMGTGAPGIKEHPMLKDPVLSLLAVIMNASAHEPDSTSAAHEIIRAVKAYQESKKGVL
jgi:hypothetical protein